MQLGWALGLLNLRPGPRGRRRTDSIRGWDLSDAIAMCTAIPRDGRLANSTFHRTAGSHSLAAAGERDRSPHKRESGS